MLRYVRNLVPRMGLGSDEVWASIVHVLEMARVGDPKHTFWNEGVGRLGF